jgi:hypothetical protein
MAPQTESRWYIRESVGGQGRQIWLFTETTATRWGVSNPENGPGTFFKAEPGETIWQCIDRLTGWLKPGVTEGLFEEIGLGPAEYYPRMARPLVLAAQPTLWSPPLASEMAYIAGARSQLTLLVRRLEQICQTVQPAASTLQVYGHEIRNLLILASTEAEMHLRGILKANGSQITKPNSNQYVKLVAPLKLDDYTVAFLDFPALAPVAPFAGWATSDPTDSLRWYAAYHGTKHNREEEFERGTLEHAFAAVAACLALLVAQFGPIALGAELGSYVSIGSPTWAVGEMYMPRVTEADWTPISYPGLA